MTNFFKIGNSEILVSSLSMIPKTHKISSFEMIVLVVHVRGLTATTNIQFFLLFLE